MFRDLGFGRRVLASRGGVWDFGFGVQDHKVSPHKQIACKSLCTGVCWGSQGASAVKSSVGIVLLVRRAIQKPR